jgi:amino acid adenylation domain-containing protein
MSASHSATIPDCIRRLAEQFPSRLAVFDIQSRLTFGGLNTASSRVAQSLLAARGPAPEAVLLLFDVNTNAVIAGLAAMKAAKFYVGVDPFFPPQRIVQIVKDAGVTVILTDTQNETRALELTETSHHVINIEKITIPPAIVPEPTISASSLALLNYTSGSTGTPKAVMQSHQTAFTQATRYAKAYRMAESDRTTCFGSLAWAGAFWDSFGALAEGVPVGMYDLRQHGLNRLQSWLAETGITILCGATVLRRFAQDFSNLHLPNVRLIEVGGDTIYAGDVAALQRIFPRAVIAAGMGLSEAGRITEHFISPGVVIEPGVVPVGYPVAGIRILLLSENGQDVKQGEVGEIVVQGPFLARGYWQQPGLTSEKFRHDPHFGNEPLYFTGDLGRQLPDGRFRHLGRKDFQIKIHGYQVQADDIEALLLAIEGIHEVCVVVHDLPDAGQELVAYLVPNASSHTNSLIEVALPESLPRYMHPQRYVCVTKLPKTPTGKINRKQISNNPDAVVPIGEILHRHTVYVAPQTFMEKWLVDTWTEILQVDKIGRMDTFFDLGGNSLHAMRIFNRLRSDFELELSIKLFFEYPTVAQFAACIDKFIEAELDQFKDATF